MTVQETYTSLHALIDQLTPDQASALRPLVDHLVHPTADVTPTDSLCASSPQRTLSFTGIMNAEPDLSERSEEILRSAYTARDDTCDYLRYRTVQRAETVKSCTLLMTPKNNICLSKKQQNTPNTLRGENTIKGDSKKTTHVFSPVNYAEHR